MIVTSENIQPPRRPVLRSGMPHGSLAGWLTISNASARPTQFTFHTPRL